MGNGLKGKAKPPSALSKLVAETVMRLMTQKYALSANRPRALANDAGVTLSTVQRLLNADAEARLNTLEAVASAFGVPPFQLLVPWEMLVNLSSKAAASGTLRREPLFRSRGAEHAPRRLRNFRKQHK